MNDIEIRAQLDKIIASNAFSLSGVYKRLLKYLTEATLKGEKPKEFTIGYEVFNQDVDDPSTSRVRVSIYKLRQRLDKYYKDEGVKDNILFTIPKGGYSLKFTHNKETAHKSKNNTIWIVLLAFAIPTIASFVYYITQCNDYDRFKNTVFWEELINNKKKTVIIAGDFFVYRDIKYERDHERYINVRDIHIDSKEQLEKYLEDNPEMKKDDYSILDDVTYMPRDALFSMQYIFPLLYENKVKYEIILSSDFNWETYKNYNIIYIGAFKNLKQLSILIDKLKIKYNNLDHSITITNKEESKTYSSQFMLKKNIDYTLVSKLPGSNNNVIHLFVSNNDIGCIETVKRFTQLDSLKHFENRFLNDANYFKAIYKAEGIERTNVTCGMVEFETITDSTLTNFWHY